jgi:spore coat polysaccharide biosynthesis predicted glycosyltransferase SpsG
MAPIYLQADLAISAGGSSCYELMYFGIPTLIIIVANNQVSIANELNRQHIGISLGRKNEIQHEYLKKKIKELLENRSLRKRLRQNGRRLVDGKGKKRIVDCMETIL